jgi:hypothetical protein
VDEVSRNHFNRVIIMLILSCEPRSYLDKRRSQISDTHNLNILRYISTEDDEVALPGTWKQLMDMPRAGVALRWNLVAW